MVRILFSLVACVGLGVTASVVTPRYTVKESVDYVPRGWAPITTAPSSHTFKLRIGLAQPNFEQLEAELYQVSDPSHPRYGKHLSKERVEELAQPHPDGLKHVHEWLDCHGVHKSNIGYSPAKDWVIAEVTVEQAEKLLDTKYHIYEHASSGRQLIRTKAYSLPEHLHGHVETIQPTTYFNGIRAMRATFHTEPEVDASPVAGLAVNAAIDPSCNATITPACLQALYNTAGYKPKNNPQSSLGIAGYLDQYANDADLQLFYAKYLPSAVNQTYKIELVHGGINPQDPEQAGVEANLDVQYGGAISSPIQNIYYSTPGSPPWNPSPSTPNNTNEPYAEFLDYILAQKNLPQTLTTSYGEDEESVPESYARKVCSGFAQLGARGVSILFSSGDFGVGDGNPTPESTECVSNDGKNTKKFLPAFPAGCPYVTAVGGTHFVPEVAVGFSGGGFSNYFKRPLYQTLQVEGYILKYLDGGKTYKGLWNQKGRAYPDIAAQGSHFRVFVGGREGGVGGTSASSPTVAGVIALLNDALIARGRPPLGFLNPWLYTIGQFALNDITAGNNPGCGTPGFNATKGWDPVTGLGTPDFKKLLKAVGIFDENF